MSLKGTRTCSRRFVERKSTLELAIGSTGPLTSRLVAMVFPVDISLSPIELGQRRLVLAVVRDITERRRAEAQVQQLMRELRHRVKNILSIVQAMAHQATADSVHEFVSRFSERIRGLSRALICWSRTNGKTSRWTSLHWDRAAT